MATHLLILSVLGSDAESAMNSPRVGVVGKYVKHFLEEDSGKTLLNYCQTKSTINKEMRNSILLDRNFIFKTKKGKTEMISDRPLHLYMK